jgi:hypothetical protein
LAPSPLSSHIPNCTGFSCCDWNREAGGLTVSGLLGHEHLKWYLSVTVPIANNLPPLKRSGHQHFPVDCAVWRDLASEVIGSMKG